MQEQKGLRNDVGAVALNRLGCTLRTSEIATECMCTNHAFRVILTTKSHYVSAYIKKLVFTVETHCVLCEIRFEFLYILLCK
jgi:hypothetical protein